MADHRLLLEGVADFAQLGRSRNHEYLRVVNEDTHWSNNWWWMALSQHPDLSAVTSWAEEALSEWRGAKLRSLAPGVDAQEIDSGNYWAWSIFGRLLVWHRTQMPEMLRALELDAWQLSLNATRAAPSRGYPLGEIRTFGAGQRSNYGSWEWNSAIANFLLDGTRPPRSWRNIFSHRTRHETRFLQNIERPPLSLPANGENVCFIKTEMSHSDGQLMWLCNALLEAAKGYVWDSEIVSERHLWRVCSYILESQGNSLTAPVPGVVARTAEIKVDAVSYPWRRRRRIPIRAVRGRDIRAGSLRFELDDTQRLYTSSVDGYAPDPISLEKGVPAVKVLRSPRGLACWVRGRRAPGWAKL